MLVIAEDDAPSAIERAAECTRTIGGVVWAADHTPIPGVQSGGAILRGPHIAAQCANRAAAFRWLVWPLSDQITRCLAEPCAELFDDLGVTLANARFTDAQDSANFGHRQTFVVVKHDDQAILFF